MIRLMTRAELNALPTLVYHVRTKPPARQRKRRAKDRGHVCTGPPLPDLAGRYKEHLTAYLGFMERARHRQGYGAARNNLQRFMDRQGWVTRDNKNEEDWSTTAPHRTVIYPPSLFKGRGKDPEERRCAACERLFEAKRRDAKYCGAACRKWATRHR
jgi:hypothetical protein